MSRFRIALLTAAIVTGVPGAAFAQDQARGDHADGRRGGGEQGGGDRGGGDRGGNRGRADAAPTPPAPQAPQAPPQASYQPRPDMRGGGDRRDVTPGGQSRFQDGNRADNGRVDDRRFQDHRFDDRRFDGSRGGDRRWDDRGVDGRPGDGRPGYPSYNDRRAYGRQGGPGLAGRGDDRRPGGGWRPGYDWRGERAYDWRGFRDSHRDVFRVGRYYAPRGWGYGYRRFGIGAALPSFFYAQDYWLADPWEYRLPAAYGPYRWVRYYDDVLLVDLRSGRIVDAIPDFFV